MKKICVLVLWVCCAWQIKSQSLVDSLYLKQWEPNAGIFENLYFQKNFIHPSCTRLDSFHFYQYSTSQSTWNLRFVSLRNFDNSGRILEQFTLEGTQRLPFGKILFNYQGGLLSDSIEQEWDNSANKFVNQRRTLFKRRPDTRPDTVIIQTWDIANAKWQNFRRELISYATGNGLNEITVILQDWSVNKWVNSRKEISAFEITSNKQLDYASQSWNSDSSKWINQYRVTFTYNAQNKLELVLREDFVKSSNSWVNSSRSIFTYSGSAVEIVGQGFDEGSGTWYNFLKMEYLDFCQNTLSIEQNIFPEIRIFPNPTSSLLHLEGKEPLSIQLADINGKTLWQSAAASDTHQLDLSDLAPGIYWLQLNIGKQQYTRKVAKW
jgi:hypothetical protein